MEFQGRVAYSYADSTPWWPEPTRVRAGAPNVLLVLLDDVGFANFGCFGAPMATPAIDRLADGGLRYTNFTTTALCSSSRAALLTGRNHHSVGFGTLPGLDSGYPGYYQQLPRSAATIARLLRDGGYNAFHLGKWHLVRREEGTIAGPYDRWPLGLGFERAYGFMDGDSSQWEPVVFEDNHYVDPPWRPGYHLTEDLADHAIAWIGAQKSAAPEKPFFCYFSTGALHAPHHAPAEYIARYAGAFDDGWDVARERTLARQIEMGVVPAGTHLAPRVQGVQPWDELDTETRRLFARMMEIYAAYMEHTDAQIGRVVSFLDDIGALDDTLVVVTADNGASAEGGYLGSANELRMANGLGEEVASLLARIDDLGGPLTYNHYPVGWAQVSNTPYKWFKQTAHYGGVKDPLVVHWPNGIASRGKVRKHYCHIIDIGPTILELAGVEPPGHVDGVEQQAIEGVSIAATFDEASAPDPRRTQYFEMFANRGIYHEGWKAVTFHGRMPWEQAKGVADFDADVWELYHVEEDFSEVHDLAAKHPEKLEELKRLWLREAEAFQVLPLDDRFSARALDAGRPRLYADRRRWVLYPGTVQLDGGAAPWVHRTAHQITVEIEDGGAGASGVLVAWGGRTGGWALLVDHGGCPAYVFNHLGERVTIVRAPRALAEGSSTVTVRSTPAADGSAAVELVVDGVVAGRGEVPETAPLMASFMEGLCVGRDMGSPVCDLYEVPGEFTGRLRCVVVDRSGSGTAQTVAVAAAEQVRQ